MDLRELGLKLGNKTDADGLDPVPRILSRRGMDLPELYGHDLWNAWEVGYLTPQDRPVVWHMQCMYGAETANIVESKSFKLFLNARNHERFANLEAFTERVRSALEVCVKGSVDLRFYAPEASPRRRKLAGHCIDHVDIDHYPETYAPESLETTFAPAGAFALHSHMLRSLCPITAQPDWGALEIQGEGPRTPSLGALLAYVSSLRRHQDFHEACCERIYRDLHRALRPTRLMVRCLYTRRGGLDICPVRSSHPAPVMPRESVWRQ